VVGFGFAAQILLRSLTRRDLNDDPEEFVPEDALIYPLAYCTRHFVELFLKDIHLATSWPRSLSRSWGDRASSLR
jgi:hypothetical protein